MEVELVVGRHSKVSTITSKQGKEGEKRLDVVVVEASRCLI